MKKRAKGEIDYRFKILYALGIIFVVAGHDAGGGFESVFQVGGWFPFYSFHLALFMFCSGYFYKLDSHDHAISYILKKIKRLIVPLFLWNIFYALFCLFISNFGFKFGVPITIEKLTIDVITTGHQFIFNLGGWFVIPLFMTQVATVAIRKIMSHYNHWTKEWLLAFLYCGVGLVGIWLGKNGWNEGWPLVFTRMAALMPFYGLGILYKTKLEKRDKIENWKYFTLIFIIQLIVIIRSGGVVPNDYPGAQSWSIYSSVFSTLVIGVTGIAFWLRISKIIEPLIGKNRIVNLIANNTFSIMIHQFLGFWVVNLMLGSICLIIKRGSFDWEGFKTIEYYRYLPLGCHLFGVLYLIGGLAVPLAMAKVVNVTRKKMLCVTGRSS